jgi:hypothetical protein
MGLLSRSKNTAAASGEAKKKAPPRPTPARVRLRPEELKQSNQINRREQIAGSVVAAVEMGATLFVAFRGGLVGHEKISIPLMAVASIVFVALVWRTNRLGAMLGALGVFILWAMRFPLDVLWAYPLMGYMLYLTLVSTRSRQAIQRRRLAEGDLADGVEEARAARAASKSKPTYATNDASGRALPAKSSRYTPPKAKKP